MSMIIDLDSSDEEKNDLPAATSATENTKSAPALEKAATASELQNETIQNELTATNVDNKDTSPEPKTTISSLLNQKDQRAHRRKSQHQMLRSSPEIEFEKLSPQNKNKNGRDLYLNMHREPVPKKKNPKKISILASKPLTCEQLLDAEFEKLLKDDVTLSLIREISAERVRINQLLSSNFMPEINFSLYTKYEMLEFQLNERFKQKDIFLKSLSERNLNGEN